MNPLLMTLFLVGPTLKTPLMARDAILMCLDAAFVASVDRGAEEVGVLAGWRSFLFPAKWKIRGRHDLDEVHIIKGLLIGNLLRPVKWVNVVVCPAARLIRGAAPRHALDHHVGELRAEAEMVDLVREAVVCAIFEVVVQVMHMEVSVRKTLSGRNVEVSDNLVNSDAALETTAFLALSIQVLRIVFTFALFHSLSTTEGPRDTGVRIAHIVTRITATRLCRIGRWRGAITLTTVGWI